MSKVTCIDVSCWQTGIDYKKIKNSGIEAIIIRSGYGREVSQKDTQFETHYAGAKAAGLKIGSYWYSYADSVEDAKKEAKACLSCIKGKSFDLPIYFDMEDPSQTKLGKSTLTKIAIAFCDAIKAGGYTPGVYANLNWFNNYLDYSKLKSKYSIWLAQYNSTNQLQCDIWQNSSDGKLNGYSGRLDTNVIFNRSILSTSSKRVTVNDVISVAKSLVGNDSDPNACDVMKWYGTFSTKVNDDNAACCCAGQMYLMNKAGALDRIPGGKTANCGVLAVNFYKAGQLYKPSQVKSGDMVVLSWSKETTSYYAPMTKEGYKTLDHVELCIGVGKDTITTIGCNNGGKECDDFQVKIRNKSNISCCCRIKYDGATTSSSNTSTPKKDNTTKKNDTSSVSVPKAKYKVRANGRWLPEVTNLGDYAGLTGKAITDVAIKFTSGSCKYRVMVGGKWLPYVTGYNTKDYNNGYAGNGKPIQAIEVYYNTPADVAKKYGYYKAKYRVSPTNRSYYPWQYDNEKTNGQDGYAGYKGIKIDRFQLTLSK